MGLDGSGVVGSDEGVEVVAGVDAESGVGEMGKRKPVGLLAVLEVGWSVFSNGI